ncbi:MAG: ribosome biogenesis GTPase YlqF, partial [Oscillospiraceae bacterium]|nr:ribosome biogenesis GTPase YlqF [Oscillospiraceae bacterium]
MKKAVRQMEEDLRLVDAVVEIRDARIPESSRNPDIDKLCVNKPRMVILNRCDQADSGVTTLWRRALEGQGMAVLETDCKSGRGVNAFPNAARQLLRELIERSEAKGQVGRMLRFMVLGI